MIGPSEILALIVVALLLFGPDKLPELARSLGKAMGDFKKAQRAAELELKDLDSFTETKEEPPVIDTRIKKMAEDAGIDTEGKTNEELITMLTNIVKA
ncbi:MAG: twin-arginine translocase TatA/TatE family subunit [Methanosarcinaceae archaeon]|nr:twin-arginine translocase TatA/TatE family subunit [Methanosarcinaceae archaeon]